MTTTNFVFLLRLLVDVIISYARFELFQVTLLPLLRVSAELK